VAKVSEAVLNALSAKKQSDVKAWEEEIKPCTHTQHLKQFSTPQLNLNGIDKYFTELSRSSL
jgi:ubiquitin carboxyl-terminal hydrolase 5/13